MTLIYMMGSGCSVDVEVLVEQLSAAYLEYLVLDLVDLLAVQELLLLHHLFLLLGLLEVVVLELDVLALHQALQVELQLFLLLLRVLVVLLLSEHFLLLEGRVALSELDDGLL